MLLSRTSGSGFDEVAFFIRFSKDLVEAARERGITLYRASSHKLVESVIDMILIEKDVANEQEEEVDNEQEEEVDTRSANNSPDGPTSRSSLRIIQQSVPAPLSAGDIRMQRSAQRSARQSNPAIAPKAPIFSTRGGEDDYSPAEVSEQGLTIAQLAAVKKESFLTTERLKAEQLKFNFKVKEVLPILILLSVYVFWYL